MADVSSHPLKACKKKTKSRGYKISPLLKDVDENWVHRASTFLQVDVSLSSAQAIDKD